MLEEVGQWLVLKQRKCVQVCPVRGGIRCVTSCNVHPNPAACLHAGNFKSDMLGVRHAELQSENSFASCRSSAKGTLALAEQCGAIVKKTTFKQPQNFTNILKYVH